MSPMCLRAIIRNMERFRLPLIVILLAAIIAGGVMLVIRQNTSSCPVEIVLPALSEEIKVYVSGEVQRPGNYVLSEGSRIDDAIEAAGGFAPAADRSALNLAGMLRDGARIHVYKTGESTQLININTAPVWLLTALPGIGEATAEAIVEYRSQEGSFDSVDDLKKVKGIGDSTFEKLQDKITVY